MNPKASVIVLVWNGQDYLQPCLSALLEQEYEPLEVIVVDNASTDDSAAVIEGFLPSVHFIRNDYNFGFAGGNNIGIQAATGEVVVLLNQDTVVQPGWLGAIVKTFADETIGIVGCKALYPEGRTIQHAGGYVQPDDAFTVHFGQGEEDHGQYDDLTDVEYVTGAAFAIHRRVLDRLGNLDERFHPAFYEEIDYCYRARRAGFRVVYQPEAVFCHYETTTLPEHSYQHVAAFHRSRVRFVLLHWDAQALKRFADAESQAIAQTSWLDDAVARAQAYWNNLLDVPTVVARRRDDTTLGPSLTRAQARWLSEEMRALRRQAHRHIAMLIQGAVPAATAEREPESGASSGTPEVVPWEERSRLPLLDFSRLQSLLDQLETQHVLREHRFTSEVPLIGSLIARFRSFWLSVAARWYVFPIIQQQSAFNARLLQEIAEMMRLMQLQERRWRTMAEVLTSDEERLVVQMVLDHLEQMGR
jgi:GT2 family glycosyltransferase